MANWGNVLAGGLGGAGTGASIGSFGGPVGIGVGAGIGGLAGLLASYFGDQPREAGAQRLSAPNEQEQSILNFLQQHGQSLIQNPGQGFQPIADQARAQFHQNTVPSLAERFTSMGSNALSSPSFAAQIGQAGSGLEQALAAMQAQYGQQNQQNGLQMLQTGLKPAFQTDWREQEPGLGHGILNTLLASKLPELFQSGYKQYKEDRAKSKLAKANQAAKG